MRWPSDRILLALAVVWLAANVSPVWYPTPDGAGYLSVARELVDTGRLRNLGSPHIYYPVGYSVLLAPLFLRSDEPFLLVSLLHFGLAVGLLALVYRWVREHFPEHAGWVTLLTVANVSFGDVYRRTLGETAFMVAWMLAGLCFQRLAKGRLWQGGRTSHTPPPLVEGRSPHGAEGDEGGRGEVSTGSPPGRFAADLPSTRGGVPEPPSGPFLNRFSAVFLASLAFIPLVLLRPAGAMLAGGFVACLALAGWRKEQRWRALLLCSLAVLPAAAVQLAWMARDRRAAEEAGTVTYSEQFRDSARSPVGQLVEGLRLRVQETGRLLVPGLYRSYGRDWLDVNMLVYLPVTAGVAGGWWRAVRRRRDVHLWALPFYVGLYVAWPHDQNTRFFTPILPMLLVCALDFWRGVPAHWLRRAGIAFAVLHLGTAAGFWLFDDRRHNDRLAARVPELREAVAVIPMDARDRVAVSTGGQDEQAWLAFLLNRPVTVWEPPQPLPASVKWLIVRAGDPVPPGFAPAAPRLWAR